jgi:LacI family transcriptional regulator
VGATIDDVARLAGVSISTVSRVINNPGLVNERTRRRVARVIERTGFKPNIFARGLMRSRTGAVGILVSYITNPYMTAIVDAVESTLSRNDVFIYLCNCNDDRKLEHAYANELLRRKVDALVVIETPSFNGAEDFLADLGATCPVVLVNEHVRMNGPHHVVRCEQEPGVREALRHLLSRGQFPIALFTGSESQYSFALKERLFQEFRLENRLSEAETLVFRLGDTNVEQIVTTSAQLMARLCRQKSRPRAVLAGNDMIGVGVLQGALAAGLRIPEDVAIIGVDNTLLSRISSPQLSTVDLRTEDVGRSAAELYLRLRGGRGDPITPVRETVSSFLVLRGTT